MGGKSAPDAPDYTAAAQAQGEANIEAARLSGKLSNPNVYTPLGSRTVQYGSPNTFDQAAYNAAMARYNQQLREYNEAGGTQQGGGSYIGPNNNWGKNPVSTPIPEPVMPNRQDFFVGGDPDQVTVRERLTPEGQKLFDLQMGISQRYGQLASGGLDRVADAYGQPFDVAGLPEISEGTLERDRVEQAILDRMQPRLDRQRQRQTEALLQQGHSRGGLAYDEAIEAANQRENDALISAILAGGQEQNRLYGLESQNRQRALQEQAFLRNLPLSEVNALRTGSQPQMPQFQAYQGQSVAPAPMFNATQQQYGADLGAWNAEQASANNFMGGLFSLGGAALGGPFGGAAAGALFGG